MIDYMKRNIYDLMQSAAEKMYGVGLEQLENDEWAAVVNAVIKENCIDFCAACPLWEICGGRARK